MNLIMQGFVGKQIQMFGVSFLFEWDVPPLIQWKLDMWSFLSRPILLCINVVFIVAIWPWLVMPPLPTFWTALTGLVPISCGNAAFQDHPPVLWIFFIEVGLQDLWSFTTEWIIHRESKVRNLERPDMCHAELAPEFYSLINVKICHSSLLLSSEQSANVHEYQVIESNQAR